MADISISFDSGVKTLEISDGKGHSVEVSFNPYDVIFLGTIMDAAEKLDEKQEKLKNITNDDWEDVYNTSVTTDKEMREIIDGVFGTSICAELFPKQTVFAVGSGLPAWANLLYAVVDKMDEGLEGEKQKAKERIRKYSEKYKRK